MNFPYFFKTSVLSGFVSVIKAAPNDRRGLNTGRTKGLAFEADSRETLVELRQLTTGVDQLMSSTGPGWVRRRIDIELQRVTWLAPSGARGEG